MTILSRPGGYKDRLTSGGDAPAGLNRQALAAGAAGLRARALAVETEIDLACETAAIGARSDASTCGRDLWDERTWSRYVAEAINQSREHATALTMLYRRAERLDKLLITMTSYATACHNACPGSGDRDDPA